jgi:hypothetical protein
LSKSVYGHHREHREHRGRARLLFAFENSFLYAPCVLCGWKKNRLQLAPSARGILCRETAKNAEENKRGCCEAVYVKVKIPVSSLVFSVLSVPSVVPPKKWA